VANLLVHDLVAYEGPGTTYTGPTVGALQDATLVNTGSSGGGTSNVFSVFSAIAVSSSGLGYGQGPGAASAISITVSGTPAQDVVASHSVVTPVTTIGTPLGLAPRSLSQSGSIQALGAATNSNPLGQTSRSPATVTITPVSTNLGTREAPWSMAQAAASSPVNYVNPGESPATDREILDGVIASRPRTGLVSDAVLDELAADKALWPAQQGYGTITIPALPTGRGTGDPVIGDSGPQGDRPLPPADYAAGLAVLGLAAGLWARGTGLTDARKRRAGRPFFKKKSI